MELCKENQVAKILGVFERVVWICEWTVRSSQMCSCSHFSFNWYSTFIYSWANFSCRWFGLLVKIFSGVLKRFIVTSIVGFWLGADFCPNFFYFSSIDLSNQREIYSIFSLSLLLRPINKQRRPLWAIFFLLWIETTLNEIKRRPLAESNACMRSARVYKSTESHFVNQWGADLFTLFELFVRQICVDICCAIVWRSILLLLMFDCCTCKLNNVERHEERTHSRFLMFDVC